MGAPSAPRRIARIAAWAGLCALGLRPAVGDRATAAPGDPVSAAAAPAGDVSCDALSPAALRGKRIFQRGIADGRRPVEGALAGGAAVLSGGEAACARCHGPEGEGAAEGGVTAPPISLAHLSSPTRARGAYTAAAIAAAITAGRAPDGRPLHPVMPRYRLDDGQVSDMIEYLACVGRDPDPGVTPDEARLGAALPLSGPAASLGAAVRDTLAATLAEVNAQGGIYRRRLELVVEDSAPAGELQATARLLDRGVLALLSSSWSGDPALAERLAEERAPLVGPLGGGLAPDGGVIFQLHPGPDVLARVAVQHLAAITRAPTLVVSPRDPSGDAWAAGARVEAARRGLPAPIRLSHEPGRLDCGDVEAAAQRSAAGGILFWGSGADLARCAALGSPRGGPPVYALLRPLGDDREARRRAAARAIFLDPGPMSVQASARASAAILVEAMKRVGAYPTRERLIAAIEGLRGFEVGPSPPVTFARNRRIGVLGARLVRLDPDTGAAAPVSAWIEVVP